MQSFAVSHRKDSKYYDCCNPIVDDRSLDSSKFKLFVYGFVCFLTLDHTVISFNDSLGEVSENIVGKGNQHSFLLPHFFLI